MRVNSKDKTNSGKHNNMKHEIAKKKENIQVNKGINKRTEHHSEVPRRKSILAKRFQVIH